MSRTPLTIVIPCRNEAGSITYLLDAIAQQDQLADETLIVDDGSVDDTVTKIQTWHAQHPELNLRVLQIGGGPIGAGAAMNAGIQVAQPGIILRLDGHSRPAPDYVRRSIEAIAEKDVGVVGGTWRVAPGAATRMGRAIAAVVAHTLGSGGVAYRHPTKGADVERVDTVPFGCFRRELWQELGGFDETLLANQDYDFNYRVQLAGYDVVIDRRITSVYEARPTLRSLARQYFRYGFWKCRMLRKFPAALQWRQLPPILMLPVLTLLAVAIAAGSRTAAAASTIYLGVIVSSAVLIGYRLRDFLLVPHAAVAMLTVHFTWSAGFWVSAFTSSTSSAPIGR